MKTTYAWNLLFGIVALVGCADANPEESAVVSQEIEIDVASDPGHGVGSAEIVAHGQPVVTTDGAGHAKVPVHGNEGDVVELAVRCPPGFDSPPQPISVTICRLSPGARAPHFEARCAPQTRTLVVGVRADRGPNLPILHFGREIARTDASGSALVTLTVKPGEHVALVLDTKSADPKAPKLLPESPTLAFVAADHDEFVVLDQRFEVGKSTVKAGSNGPTGPKRI